MTNTLITYFLGLAIAILLIETFSIGYRLKKLFNIPLHEIRKPFDCRFCMYSHITMIVTIALFFLNDVKVTILLLSLNIITAHLIELYYEKNI